MSELSRVVVVGASAAGITAVETLRRLGFNGSITLVGDEPHLPYDRPPLSKQVLSGAWDVDRITLRDNARLDQLAVDLRLGTRAVSLDLDGRSVELDDGNHIAYDGLIIATGIAPRRLATGHDLAGVQVLRTVDDALALRSQMTAGRRLVVVGAGFLGCEVAAAARGADMEVSIVDPLAVPMLRQLGEEIGSNVANLHRENGVDLYCGVGVHQLLGDGAVTSVELTTGAILPADLVLVAIGSVPTTDWLAGSGLTLDDGIVCDFTCRAAPGVYAAGDVARWLHPGLGEHIRIEHRTNATEQGIAAASNLLGADSPFSPTPYFWSDQYDARIQAFGTFPPDCRTLIAGGNPDEGRFIVHYIRDNKVMGVLAWNMPKQLRAEIPMIGQPVEVARLG
jgi:3-phenylpropionate/trans-cinnamate dioxygenase ferredoxin reductase component